VHFVAQLLVARRVAERRRGHLSIA
jgi:hypothetical protein